MNATSANKAHRQLLILALLAAVALVGCGDSSDGHEAAADQPAASVWTLRVTPAGGGTRALTPADDYQTLTESWAAGEQVYVYQQTGTTMNHVGTLTAETGGSTTTLSGTVRGTFSTNGKLWLYTHPLSATFYDNQDGTLATLAARYDLLFADIAITTADAARHELTTSQPIFQALRSICRFTLEDDKHNALNATRLTVEADNSLVIGYDSNWEPIAGSPVTLTANLGGTSNVVFLSMADYMSDKDTGRPKTTYKFTATVGSDTYSCTKSAKLQFGNYYITTLTMTRQ